MSLHPSTLLGWAWLWQGLSELLLGIKAHQWVLPGLPGKWDKAFCPHNMQDPTTVPSGPCHGVILPAGKWFQKEHPPQQCLPKPRSPGVLSREKSQQ